MVMLISCVSYAQHEQIVGRSAGPPPRCLHFYPAACSAREFIKKIKSPILIPSASFSHVKAPCGCPSWTRTHTPIVVVARPICRRLLAPRHVCLSPLPSRALVLVVLALPIARGAPNRTKPGASGSGARARRWRLMLVVLARDERELPLCAGQFRTLIATGAPPPLCCKCMFQVFS
jgi:hypothetical protein